MVIRTFNRFSFSAFLLLTAILSACATAEKPHPMIFSGFDTKLERSETLNGAREVIARYQARCNALTSELRRESCSGRIKNAGRAFTLNVPSLDDGTPLACAPQRQKHTKAQERFKGCVDEKRVFDRQRLENDPLLRRTLVFIPPTRPVYSVKNACRESVDSALALVRARDQTREALNACIIDESRLSEFHR